MAAADDVTQQAENAERDNEIHLDALETAKEWRERQLVEKLE
nr:10157_t:CDS:2 [Entrophospora candida]